MATYTIFTKDLEATTKKINRIAKKCQKANVPFVFNVGESYDKVIEVKNANGDASHYVLNLTDIEVNCQFKHDGWTALGLVQRKDGIVQCYFNDASLIKEYSKTDFHCDHCKKHVHRNSVVVLEHENGGRKVVGTSCVEEFTCGLSGNLVASFADLSFELENDCERIARMLDTQKCSNDDAFDIDAEWSREMNEFLNRCGSPCYDVNEIIACAANIISTNGFKPSSDIEATWKFILDCYDKYNKYVTESDKAEAKKAIDWILSMNEDERTQSSYIFNLYQICASGYCTMRHFGLLASLIPSYKKSESKRIQSETKAISNYVGNVGDKFNLTLTYIRTVSYESQYGVGYFHFFMDEQGNIFKWSTNSPMEYGVKQQDFDNTFLYTLDAGAIVKVSGRIKSHDEYRGEKQTVITRCKYEVIESKERDIRIAEEKEAYETYIQRKANKEKDPDLAALDSWF